MKMLERMFQAEGASDVKILKQQNTCLRKSKDTSVVAME